jgi:hypothetical protein
VTRKRWELAVATAAAWIAFARAFLPASPLLHGIAAAIALAAAVVAVAFPWRAAPPRVARWASLILRLLLVVVGGLVVFARQFPLVRDDNARVTGALAGVALALLAFAFLAGQRVWAVHTHLVPAVIGVLVAAGLERTGVAFPFLAALAGLAVWLDAFRTGGPRRFGLPALARGPGGWWPACGPTVRSRCASRPSRASTAGTGPPSPATASRCEGATAPAWAPCWTRSPATCSRARTKAPRRRTCPRRA